METRKAPDKILGEIMGRALLELGMNRTEPIVAPETG